MEAEHAMGTIAVEVAYATPKRQVILAVQVAAGSSVAEAIEKSGIRAEFPDMEIDPAAVGIFSRKVAMDHVLQEGDRVEIYRPLIADPKESRRKRAAAGKAKKPVAGADS
jgi:putative ubiquitin-RnfH superfamily antitoxin RatB of RatAB toxin-antitoxin module